MYNRYVPLPDGSFKKQNIPEPVFQPEEKPAPLPASPEKGRPDGILSDFSQGDLMTLLAMLLIASEGGENRTTALLTLAFYFLL